jgi:hypothetical protein
MVLVNAPLADEARCERESPLLATIEMFVCSAEGNVFSGVEYGSFLEQAGFVEVGEVYESLIKAVKP